MQAQGQHWPIGCLLSVMYCVVLYWTIGVTIEAEPGMTVYGQCWGQISSTQCTSPLMYARDVFVWVMGCSWHYSDSACESVGTVLSWMFTVRRLVDIILDIIVIVIFITTEFCYLDLVFFACQLCRRLRWELWGRWVACRLHLLPPLPYPVRCCHRAAILQYLRAA